MHETVRQISPRAGFSTLDSEVSVDDLPVSGTLPEWLSGTLLRNGPGAFEAGERPLRHWFDGLAMIHRFTVAGGRVSYANRFLRTRAYRAAREEGRLAYSEFATDPCLSIFKRLMTLFKPKMTDNTFVTLTKLGEQHLAMTEAPMSVAFDPDTLETLGYGPRGPGLFGAAHPHVDPDGGGLIHASTSVGRRNAYRFFRQPPEGRADVLASIPVGEPAYVHSFGMSERWLALTEFPFVFNPLKMALSSQPFIRNFRWEPERGTRIHVVDRHSGEPAGVFETEAAFAFHHVGAWEEGSTLVMQICDHEDPGVMDALYLDRLRSEEPQEPGRRRRARLRRLELDLDSGRVRDALVSDQDIEMPRINDARCHLRPYRYVYGVGATPGNAYEVADLLVKLDTATGEAVEWGALNCYPGEPIFVARPGAPEEDGGVALSVVFDAAAERSFLLVLDAASWTELARAEAPHRIPMGIHGAFYSQPAT